MLIAVSVMAPVYDPFYRFVVSELARRSEEDIRLVEDVDWPERERWLRQGLADVGFVCGLPYVEEADRDPPTLSLLGAPAMVGPRYGGRPVYFSDVIVVAESPFTCFADLEGARWAYNEPNSHSGYNVVRWRLASQGIRDGFFGSVVASGSHENTISLISAGAIDAAAVDSTVLERVFDLRPEMRARFRVLETLGPSPMPPVVAGAHIGDVRTARLRAALLSIRGPSLRPWGVSGFVDMRDCDYDPIRLMTAQSRGTSLLRLP